MDAIGPNAYQQIRAEMTAKYSSFFQLQMCQYGVVATLCIALFAKESRAMGVACATALGFVVLAVTWIGAAWFTSATRLGAYLLVAWEVPAWNGWTQDESAKETPHPEWWILANRSESRAHKGGMFDWPHFFGEGLRRFFVHQIFVIGVIIFVGCVWVSPQDSTPPELLAPALELLIAFLVTLYGLSNAKGVFKEQVRLWKDYIERRRQYDAEFLQDYGLVKQ